MNYLRISNNGLICAEDLILIGSSTKRDQKNKIGMFGSGWKYALAWLLRNDAAPKIFSGNKEIVIDFAITMHRNSAVNVITVDGIKSSLTTEMGPKWTAWMALREVLSNAIDEGGHSITTTWLPEFKGEDNKTIVYIPMNGELSDVMLKYDSYFAFNRKESYVHPLARIFFKIEPSNFNIYRKGIRCFDTSRQTRTDFDFMEVDISEDRLTRDYFINEKIREILEGPLPINIFKRLLIEEQEDWLPYNINDTILSNLLLLLNEGCTFTTMEVRSLGGILFSSADALVIRAEWYKKLLDLGLVKSPFEFLMGDITFIRTDAKDVSGIDYYFTGLNIRINCQSGKCETNAFISNGTCYVKDDTKLTDKEIVATALKNTAIDVLTELIP